LYFYAWRYYDPTLGRFTQPDTIVPNPNNPQDFNRYSYCNNNPINYVDPSGHSKLSKWLREKIGNPINNFMDRIIRSSENRLNAGIDVNANFGGGGVKYGSGSDLSSDSYFGSFYTRGLFDIFTGIWDFGFSKGAYYDVEEKRFMTEAEVLAKYGKNGAIIFTNGVNSTLEVAFMHAKDAKANVLFYNPTYSSIADYTEAALEWLIGTSSLSRQLGSLTTKMQVNLVGHSQGAIISSNAYIYAGFKGGAVRGSTLISAASPYGSIRQRLSASFGGATFVYGETNTFDPIKILSSGLNPVGYVEGAIGLVFCGDQHTDY